MAKLVNLAKMTTATLGTGSITLGSASSGFLTFAAAGVVNGDVVTYVIMDGGNTEIGYGTYTAAGTTLTRTVLNSTNSNNPISLSGAAVVFITAGAHDTLGGAPIEPQGRLTLTSAMPVLTATVSGAGTVYYTPYRGQCCPVWDGTQFYPANLGGELSQATTNTTKSPAAVGASSVYDMFVWDDAGTYRCTRGPAWTSATARGTGAGTTELQRVRGIWTNKVAITNGPGAGLGTYVGTIASNAGSTIDFIFGASSAGGTAAVLNVWNCYNRTKTCATVGDSTASYSYATASWRQANASETMRVTFVSGLAETFFEAKYKNDESGTSAFVQNAIGYDSATTPASFPAIVGSGGSASSDPLAVFNSQAIGSHYLQALEFGGTGATFYPHTTSMLTFAMDM